jgi:hypothetical protein
MGVRRSVVIAAFMLFAVGLVACATERGAGVDPNRGVLHKIRATYNAKEKDPDKRIKVHQVDKDDNNSNDALQTWSRCPAGSPKCKQGYPVDSTTGEPILDEAKAIDATVLFVSDYYNPGRSCVCYGPVCYCN